MASNNLAMLLLRTGRNADEAAELAAEALAKSGGNPLVLGTYACALHAAGRDDEARRQLPRAVRLNPDDPWARYFWGKQLLKDQREAQAHIQLEGVLMLSPNFPHRQEIQDMLTNAHE